MKKLTIIAIAALALCTSAAAFAKTTGYVKIYEDKGFSGRTVTVRFNKNVMDMHAEGFNDKASSVQYKIPEGYMVVLHADTGFGGSTYDMQGTGEVADLGSFNDKCSSVEWRKK